MMEDEDLLIDTPWGQKRWGIVRRGLELYNRHLEQMERVREARRQSQLKRLATIARKKAEKEANAK